MDVWGRTIDHNSSLYKLGLWMASTHSVLSCLVPIWPFHINGVTQVYHKPGFVVVLTSDKPHIKLSISQKSTLNFCCCFSSKHFTSGNLRINLLLKVSGYAGEERKTLRGRLWWTLILSLFEQLVLIKDSKLLSSLNFHLGILSRPFGLPLWWRNG